MQISPVYFGAKDLVDDSWIYRSSVSEEGDLLTGFSKVELEEIEKSGINNLVHKGDQKKLEKDLAKLKHSDMGESIEGVYRIKKSNGSYIWLRVIHQVYEKDKRNTPLKAAVVAEDITDRIALQKRLNQLVKRLEQISYKNSHEVRAPVASILGLVDIIIRQEEFSQQNQLLIENLSKSVKTLDSIIGSINDLTYS